MSAMLYVDGMNELCRLCCSSCAVEHDIFESKDELYEKIAYMPIQVRPGDGLPQRVCVTCRRRALQLHQFCREATRAQHRLLDMLGVTEVLIKTEPSPLRLDQSTQTDGQIDSPKDTPDPFETTPEPSRTTPDTFENTPEPSRTTPDPFETTKDPYRTTPDPFETTTEPCQASPIRNDDADDDADTDPALDPTLGYEPCVGVDPSNDQKNEIIVKEEDEDCIMISDDTDSDVPLASLKSFRQEIMKEERKTEKIKRNPLKRGKNESASEKEDKEPTIENEGKKFKKKNLKTVNGDKEKSQHDDIVLVTYSEDESNNFDGKERESESENDSDDSEDTYFGKEKQNKVKSKNVYTCCICLKSLPCRESCLLHYSTHSENRDPDPPPVPPEPEEHCPRCQEPLGDETWPRHWAQHWLEDRPTYTCKLCKSQQTFTEIQKIVDHGTSCHIKAADAAKYKCDKCGSKFVAMKSYLKHRLIKHFDKGKPKPRCARCNYQSKGYFDLVHHTRRAHDFVPHLCTTCGKSFKEKHHLKRHLALHTGIKPYKCNYCDKTFSRDHYRVSHEITHTGDKPYKCSICGKGFTQPTPRAVHERTVHSKERRFVCQLCGRGFATKAFLNSHHKLACV